MKYMNKIGVMMMAAGMLAAASCSDFDDYNKEVADITPSGNQTLWQNIQQNPELSDFAALVKRAGFDDELDATQYYTIWAPKNGTFDATAYSSLTDDAVMNHFVKNHIASYSHNATGNFADRVLMLNGKSYDWVGNGAYSFDEVGVLQANLPSKNGVIHVLDGEARYLSNLYQYITDSTLSRGMEIDSLRNYYLKYQLTKLDEEKSVVGPIVNGQQTYVDSVMVTSNTLWGSLWARINVEDSTYTVLMPTNKAWNSTLDKYKSYYKFIDAINAQTWEKGKLKTATTNVAAAYLQDSLARRAIMWGLNFSNKNGYNSWLVGEPTALGTDTLYTTLGDKLSNPQEILAATTATVPMSNGVGRIVDTLAFHPWELFAYERMVSAASKSNIAYSANCNLSTYRYSFWDTSVTPPVRMENVSYQRAQPTADFALPELDIYLPNVLSTTYEFYCILAPHIDDSNFGKEGFMSLPNRLSFTLNYCDASGALKNHQFLDENPDHQKRFWDYYHQKEQEVMEKDPYAFIMDPFVDGVDVEKAFTNWDAPIVDPDTLYLGDFTFPVCYSGLGQQYSPNLKITQAIDTFNDPMMLGFDRTLRITGILLKPKEFAEYEEQNKQ